MAYSRLPRTDRIRKHTRRIENAGPRRAFLGIMRNMIGQYDIVGDLHGHLDVLERLCVELGYERPLVPPPGRRMVFVGDLATRGPRNLETLLAVREAVLDGRALATLGNNDDTLLKWLRDGKGADKPKLADLIAQIEGTPKRAELRACLLSFLESLPLILRLDQNRLLVVHAGIEDRMLATPLTSEDRWFILNGDAIGKTPDGKTIRRDWARNYHGAPFVVYGHTPMDEPEVRFNTINIDTGVYRTRRLTAFRWPERQIVTAQG